MKNYIDIGINLTNRQFQNDTDTIIQNALDNEVAQMILTGTSVQGSKTAATIAKEYPSTLFSTAGIHPHDAKSFNNQSISELLKLVQLPHVIAVGECGLDFDRDFSPRDQQEKCYRAQLALAIEVQKPLFLHERAAFTRFMAVTKDYLPQLPKAVVHCFTGTLAEAKTYLNNGFYLGFTGAISDTKRFAHLEEVVKYVPLDKIMIETDAPFMLPKNVPRINLTQYRERRNEPAFLSYVAQSIASFKGITVETVALETTKNTKDFFGI